MGKPLEVEVVTILGEKCLIQLANPVSYNRQTLLRIRQAEYKDLLTELTGFANRITRICQQDLIFFARNHSRFQELRQNEK